MKKVNTLTIDAGMKKYRVVSKGDNGIEMRNYSCWNEDNVRRSSEWYFPNETIIAIFED